MYQIAILEPSEKMCPVVFLVSEKKQCTDGNKCYDQNKGAGKDIWMLVVRYYVGCVKALVCD